MAKTHHIYGTHAVEAVLNHAPERIIRIYAQGAWNDCPAFLNQAQTLSLGVEFCDRQRLEKLAQSPQHQGVVAEVRPKTCLNDQALFAWLDKAQKPPLLLVLESIQDPHNLGACLRSAEGLGVDWVVIPKANAAPLTSVVSKVACGADQILPIAQVSNIVRCLSQLQEKGIWTVGTAGSAKISITQVDFTLPTALVMGTEGKGLKRLTQSQCDTLANIPMSGLTPSLNVSVATGICLFEALRQRQSSAS